MATCSTKAGRRRALTLPTFLGNHDMGRFSTLIREDRPGISQDELLARVMLGHAMMLGLRGSPVIYYGDEQGFVGDGNDQRAREDMFPSQTAEYNDNAADRHRQPPRRTAISTPAIRSIA